MKAHQPCKFFRQVKGVVVGRREIDDGAAQKLCQSFRGLKAVEIPAQFSHAHLDRDFLQCFYIWFVMEYIVKFIFNKGAAVFGEAFILRVRIFPAP